MTAIDVELTAADVMDSHAAAEVAAAKAAESKIIVALDVDSIEKALSLAETLNPYVGGFKIGLELITTMLTQLMTAETEVGALAKMVKMRRLFDVLDGKVFWDCKFDDIPNTVGGASRALMKLRAKMFDVHASSGIDVMMEAVANKGQSLVLAITVLTSREENDGNLTFNGPTKAKVLQFAREAKLAGCDGIVCSPLELPLLGKRRELRSLLKVTPGIRDDDSQPDDQNRTMTADQAITAGADFLVIGRPIINHFDPVGAAKKFAAKIAIALAKKAA